MDKIGIVNNVILILLLMVWGSCYDQNKQAVQKDPKVNNPDLLPNELKEIDEGIVYFSADNGRTWKNSSKGLPQKISIGLGALAASSTMLGLATKEDGVYLFDFIDSVWVKIPTNQEILKSNIGSMIFYKNDIYVGTQYHGVFFSNNRGKSWATKNNGLGNLTIRRFAELDGKLYVGTNNGLYSYNNASNKWELEYGQNSIQVNGITKLDGTIYIATNQGAFRFEKQSKEWEKIFFNELSLHNISSNDKTLYAMTYNELYSSIDKGKSWQSIQRGLPKKLYSFNVIENAKAVFVGQWDGVYSKTNSDTDWKFSSKGLPAKFAATNLKAYNNLLVITTSERKLRAGMTIEK